MCRVEWPYVGPLSPDASSPIRCCEASGLLLLSQDCDLVASIERKPFVEVAALDTIDVVGVPYREIERMYRPDLVALPALKDRDPPLVARLDRVATVHKAWLEAHEAYRVPGYRCEKERQAIRHAIVRKRARAAFPDEFVAQMGRPLGMIRKRHGKDSPVGRALQQLREIRVGASPEWEPEQPPVRIQFYLVLPADVDATVPSERTPFEPLVIELERQVRQALRSPYELDSVQLVALDELTASEYLATEALDLAHLTIAGGTTTRG